MNPAHTSPPQRGVLACLLATGLLLQAACGGSDGAPGPTGPAGSEGMSTLTSLAAEAAGSNCPAGGTRLQAGLDANRNGVLDSSEVSSIQFVCAGAPGATGAGGSNGANGQTTLMVTSVEPAGSHCAVGGTRLDAGLDANSSGVLDSAEISSTAYVCHGASGSNGANGSNGTNGANGANGRNSLIAQAGEPAGVNCANGGNKITSGLDTNGDGTLQPGEVSATSYVCSPAANASMGWVQVTGTSQQAVANTGYLADNAARVTITLPDNSALSVGDRVAVTGMGAGGWTIAQNAGQRIHGGNVGVAAGTAWSVTTAPSLQWRGMAASADGTRLVAVTWGGQIYTSTDSGATWTARDSVRNWWAVASSDDGTKLVATVYNGQIYTSTDGGANWTPRASNRSWSDVASSSDGSKLVALDNGGQIYTSIDSGVNWVARESNRDWWRVASSADGTKLVAVVYDGQIYTSTDSGASWTARESSRFWQDIASSSDGSKLIVIEESGQIYMSSDSGVTWAARGPNRNWDDVALSADGTKLVAVAYGDQIYTSTDSGASWIARGPIGNWGAVASSADGSKLVAAPSFGQIFTSSTFTTTGTSGSLSGEQYDAVELQYLGGGVFLPIRHEGTLTGL